MKTICVFNQKGCVGKTTTNINICSYLAMQGFKVLAIDSNIFYFWIFLFFKIKKKDKKQRINKKKQKILRKLTIHASCKKEKLK